MSPTGDLERRQPQSGQRTGVRVHSDFGIEDHVGSRPGDLSQPILQGFGPLHEASDLRTGPIRFLIDSRTGVIEKYFEFPCIQVRKQAAQYDFPDWMPLDLPTHYGYPDTGPTRLRSSFEATQRSPICDGFGTREVTVAAQYGRHICRPVCEIERLNPPDSFAEF